MTRPLTMRRIAEAFLAEFEHARDVLIENQARGPHAEFGFRLLLFDRFPNSIVYEEGSDGPQIYAVAHQHREPGYWLSRT